VSGSCTPGTVGHWLWPNNLDMTGSSSCKMVGNYTPRTRDGPTTPCYRGATYLKRTKLRSESHHMRPGASRVLSDSRGCQALKESRHAGPHPIGHNNKHHVSSAQKVPEHRTPKPFKSGLSGFSSSRRMDDTIPPGDSNLLHHGKANCLMSFHTTG
jgi:hypothetical protein